MAAQVDAARADHLGVDIDERVSRSLSRKSGEINLLLDERFDIVWHSDTVASILGWGDVVGRSATEFVHPDDIALVLDTLLRAVSLDDHATLDPAVAPEPADVRIRTSRGEWLTFETTSWNQLDDASVRGVLVTGRRVTDRRDLPIAIEQLGTGARIEVVLPTIASLMARSMGGGATRAAIVWTTDGRTNITTAGGATPLPDSMWRIGQLAWSSEFGTDRVLIPGTDAELDDVRSDAAREGFRAAYVVPIVAPSGSGVIGAMVAWGTSSVDFHLADQSPLHVALRLAALAIADHHTKRELRWAAAHDPLTGLINRAEFERQLHAAGDRDLVLLYVDLDSFKPVNDTYGHPVGDIVLQGVARRIEQVIGGDGVVGRLGGDEFAVMCLGTCDPAVGRMIGDRIVAAAREPFVIAGAVIVVGASVGVAVGAQPLIPSALTVDADRALYQAKHTGKNTVCVA